MTHGNCNPKQWTILMRNLKTDHNTEKKKKSAKKASSHNFQDEPNEN